ncbi:anti-sigma regulatory factor (Ser/Thr protein kinase) [Streptomyces thermodiastaticus]|uniref:Anti-sigma regulatory factor (Ser/Thr protein kinase) n=1 Tax=Streptomyces thermodiastaticus TaxID=44061 RepID=A0ABU0K8S7_9ACTN|nr:anti-sigma regulatory factor (Ser/Thr protein kinase) [Streptomyces thermodiastaticus]
MTDTDGDRATWTFPADLNAVRAARRAVREQLRRWELDGVTDLAELLVSELVTNALRHATGPVGVCLSRPAGPDGVLLLEVSDPVPEPPRTRDVRLDDESGRGLQLLARSSRRWGHRTGPHGKTVWCELAVPR